MPLASSASASSASSASKLAGATASAAGAALRRVTRMGAALPRALAVAVRVFTFTLAAAFFVGCALLATLPLVADLAAAFFAATDLFAALAATAFGLATGLAAGLAAAFLATAAVLPDVRLVLVAAVATPDCSANKAARAATRALSFMMVAGRKRDSRSSASVLF